MSEHPEHTPDGEGGLRLSLDVQLDRIAEHIQSLAEAQQRLHALLDAVLAVSKELELPVVLRRIVAAAMELVGARYGALGVLDEERTALTEFIPLGLSEKEMADLAGVELPHGRGLLGHLIEHPEPLRVHDVPSHPGSAGFPPGHPPMRTLLGVAITVRDRIYGNLYLAERLDGRPFDDQDEAVVLTLAGAAGIAIENARLYDQVRSGAETFQRLLLPRLPDLSPFLASAVYRPASAPHPLGGDWYDAQILPDGALAAVIGDVTGHDLEAAAAMAQTRSMLHALLYERRTPPSLVLERLDHALAALPQPPVTTALLARIEPHAPGWTLRWSTAGHLPPLLLHSDGTARYLQATPGLPLGVDVTQPRPDHTHPLPAGATVLLFTDGLVERPDRPLDSGLAAFAGLAAAHHDRSLDALCRLLLDRHPSDGHDDMALLALRTPATAPGAASG